MDSRFKIEMLIDERNYSVEINKDEAFVIEFLETHLLKQSSDDPSKEIVIKDSSGKEIFHSMNGIDLYSDLHSFGISLPKIYQKINNKMNNLVQDFNKNEEQEEWEEYYDSLGFSVEEKNMRFEAKQYAKKAKTVEDVAALIRDTYFEAWFNSEDGKRSWGFFNIEDFTAQPEKQDEGSEGWQADLTKKRVSLYPDARVKYTGSGEDIHCFTLLDPPEE